MKGYSASRGTGEGSRGATLVRLPLNKTPAGDDDGCEYHSWASLTLPGTPDTGSLIPFALITAAVPARTTQAGAF